MSLSSGTYRIYGQSHTLQVGSFIGNSAGTNPLFIYPQTTTGLPSFSITGLSSGKYQIKYGGAPVASSSGFLVANTAPGAVATEWTLQYVPQHGANSYLISFNQASYWSSIPAGPTNQTSLQRYIYSGPTVPPTYSSGNVFQLDKLD
ncbi:hypothetical protein D9619_006326 [Psilocybe cf. subviscida]|uniref:Uncharacterized protein n=1 Tax=Psilocybe cf. subviscida TaxID=2480587 RepID=A0A8H5B4I0_9AGAR|nr:hypothetical protein D9619_006326 [Psilocybe cf. subviscida]